MIMEGWGGDFGPDDNSQDEAGATQGQKLSERIASGDISQEVVEAVAVALGWAETNVLGFGESLWKRENGVTSGHWGFPNYLTDIRLTLDEIERRGWVIELTLWATGECSARVKRNDTAHWGSYMRTTGNLAKTAITALLRALGE